MDLSILDQIPISTQGNSKTALENTVKLAQMGEKLGYKRIWYSEHHGAPNLASSAPEIVIAHVASQTKTIRIGAGGIMLMHYSPLKVAEVFKTLEAFYPNRIDLGIGRAPGGDRHAIMALAQGKLPSATNIYDKVDIVRALLLDQQPQYELYQKTLATPEIETVPSVWLLGSSGESAREAAQKGMGYSYAQFFSGKMNPEAFNYYNKNFKPSPFMPEKKLSVAFYVMACETTEEADYYALPYLIAMMNLLRGQRMNKFLTAEEATEYPLTELDRVLIEKVKDALLIGTPKLIAEKLRRYAEAYQIDEAMIMTFADPQEIRHESYRLIAKEFNL